jgi:hypothetical protein
MTPYAKAEAPPCSRLVTERPTAQVTPNRVHLTCERTRSVQVPEYHDAAFAMSGISNDTLGDTSARRDRSPIPGVRGEAPPKRGC